MSETSSSPDIRRGSNASRIEQRVAFVISLAVIVSNIGATMELNFNKASGVGTPIGNPAISDMKRHCCTAP